MTHMQNAVELARRVLGSTSPNPAVGAVVVKDGSVVGTGATQPPGQAHAEVGALNEAGDSARGATIYVTLEPCCNWGRTPPCTQAIVEAGITKVHFAVIDPNPAVSGKGRAELEAAGIEVVQEVDIEGAQELYEGFAKHINTGLPYVTAKFAMSLDGKIATHTGDSKWVTGPDARQVVQRMRRECDAVMVGVATVLADDPQLTCRDGEGQPLGRQPLRVVLDSRCRTPINAKILGQPGNTLIYTVGGAASGRGKELVSQGAEVVRVAAGPDNRVDVQAVAADLGERGVVNLLVEGGGTVLGSLFDLGLVDKVAAFVAPVIIGGAGAASPVEGSGAAMIPDAWKVQRARLEQIGPDWLITGYPAKF